MTSRQGRVGGRNLPLAARPLPSAIARPHRHVDSGARLIAKPRRMCMHALCVCLWPLRFPQPAPPDHPWRTMPHHAMTPHISGTSLSAQARYAG